MTKKVTFNLSQNQTFFYDKYIIKHNYKTNYKIIYSILYKNIDDSNWFKYLPYPTIYNFNKNINIDSYHININYKVNMNNKICLYITNNFQKPDFFSKYFDNNTDEDGDFIMNDNKKKFNIIKFRKIIINYIRYLCSNNNIY